MIEFDDRSGGWRTDGSQKQGKPEAEVEVRGARKSPSGLVVNFVSQKQDSRASVSWLGLEVLYRGRIQDGCGLVVKLLFVKRSLKQNGPCIKEPILLCA